MSPPGGIIRAVSSLSFCINRAIINLFPGNINSMALHVMLFNHLIFVILLAHAEQKIV